MADNNVSRRSVLKGVGAGLAATAAAGQATAGGHEDFNVGIKPGSPQGVAAAKRAADDVKREIDLGNQGQVVSGRFSEQALQGLRNNPHVDYVEPDYEAFKLETLTWGVDRVDADVLHSNGYTGAGATIAVLDTGIDDDHPDLPTPVDGKCFASDCCGQAGGCRYGAEGYNGNDCTYPWSDDDDHGTHCSGSATALNGNNEGVAGGVSTQADLLAGKVLTGCGSGSYSSIADGIKWAADKGADVISMSLGGSSGSSTLKNACQYAYDNNVVLVAAAGNSGPCTDCVGYPAAYSTVIAVSAIDQDDTLASYSSTGPEVELAAPGTDVLSTIPPESESDSNDGYEKFSGTSMATPHVSGAAAQVKAETSLSSNSKIRDRLKSSAEDIGLASNESGAGLLDAENAVGSSSGSNSAPTVDSLSASEVETSDSDAEFDVSWNVGDSDGNLSSVDLSLTDDSDGSTEDTASISVSGSDASGTTRLVAAGDDGAGHSYTVDITVTDGSGATASSSTSASETEDTNSSPTVDSLSASEVETSDSDAEFDVSWDVGDSDGNLSSVDLTLTDDSDGSTEDSASISVSGSDATGTTRLVAAGDDGAGNSYTVDLTVTDGSGATASGSTSVSETESTNSAPSASIDSLNNRSNPRWDRFEVSWSASDSDGNLDTVVVEMLDSSGNVLDSATNNVSGSSASGLDEVRSKQNGTDIVVTATDTAGASGSDSRSI